MQAPGYRSRIYGHYVHGRTQPLAPDSIAGLKPRRAYLRKLIRDHFPPDRDSVIIDLGCGHGAIIHSAREAGYRHIVGTDTSPEQVAAAQRLGIAGVQQGDLTETLKSLPDGSQDAVIAFDVIEHFTKDELLVLVDEVCRVLKPGGRWILHSVNGESPFFGRSLYWDFTHELAFTQASLGQLLLTSGFSRVACYEDEPVPHGVKSAIRWILWRLIRAGLRLYIAVETGDLGRKAIFSQNLIAVAIK